jgi:hypothetical protein
MKVGEWTCLVDRSLTAVMNSPGRIFKLFPPEAGRLPAFACLSARYVTGRDPMYYILIREYRDGVNITIVAMIKGYTTVSTVKLRLRELVDDRLLILWFLGGR